MQSAECAFILHFAFYTLHLNGTPGRNLTCNLAVRSRPLWYIELREHELGPTGRLALPRGGFARQFTKLLLSLLSHAGLKMVGRHGAAPCSAV